MAKNEKKKKKKGRPGLLTALKLHGLTGITGEEKTHWRQVILENENYTEEQWRGIEWYNRSDVDATVSLLDVMESTIDWPHALHRGRYMATAARIERVGLPVDRDRLTIFIEHWNAIKRYYIQRDDDFKLYNDDDLGFEHARLEKLVKERGWDWPRTPTGLLDLRSKTLWKQAAR
jgi:DNA polymerase I